MHNQQISWIDRLEQLIQQKHMLSTPFYKAWTCGHLTKNQLQTYAKEYYHHVKAFPTYISSLHSRCDDMTVRKALLSNLIDEEAGSPNHPELWRNFGLSLGLSEHEMDTATPRPETKQLVETFKKSCSLSEAIGIAVLYCYESQIPTICGSKIDGLKKWYGCTNPEDYRYFSVHETADVEHSATEKALLLKLVKPEDEETVLAHADKTLDALNTFLSSF